MPAVQTEIATQQQTDASNNNLVGLIQVVDDLDVVTGDTSFLHFKVLNYSYGGLRDQRFFDIKSEDIYDSFPSKPADKINIPEVKSIKSSFVYNYYTYDERSRYPSPSGEKILRLDSSDTEELFFQIKNKKSPRYVKLTFTPPTADHSNIDIQDNSAVVYENLDKIVAEGTMSNNFFTGVEILDTGKESKIYSMLNGSLFFSNIPQTNSQKESAQKLYDTLKEKGGLKGDDKRLIVESFANIASKGYTLSPSDVPEDIANFSSDPIGKQTFSVQFSNLLMADLIANSTVYSDNVYNDELRSLEKFARDNKAELLSRNGNNFNSNPPTFRPADYELTVEAINQTGIDSPYGQATTATLDNLLKEYPKIKFIGYLIEKFEVLPNESVELIGRKFVSGHKSNFLIDNEVRYGGSYFYKIRTLCKVQTILTSESIDPLLNQIVIGDVLMASEGILSSVTCFERLPPPPPEGLRFSFDFKTLLPKINWQFPLNKQRDIKRFQIFKRFSINEPFVAIAEFDFDNSSVRGGVSETILPENYYRMKKRKLSFVDKTHKEGEKPIYAVACVDAHGMSSNYSAQVQIERDKYTNKVLRKIISGPNAPKPFPNIYVNEDAFKDVITSSGMDRIHVFFDPEYYRVFKTREGSPMQNDVSSGENLKDLNLLAIDNNKPRYKMHIINVDNQKDQLVNIQIISRASPSPTDQDFFETSTANYNPNNLSFQYGVN